MLSDFRDWLGEVLGIVGSTLLILGIAAAWIFLVASAVAIVSWLAP